MGGPSTAGPALHQGPALALCARRGALTLSAEPTLLLQLQWKYMVPASHAADLPPQTVADRLCRAPPPTLFVLVVFNNTGWLSNLAVCLIRRHEGGLAVPGSPCTYCCCQALRTWQVGPKHTAMPPCAGHVQQQYHLPAIRAPVLSSG